MFRIKGNYFEIISVWQALRDESIKGGASYRQIEKPKRATKHSAGYDFFACEDYDIKKGVEYTIKTNIRIHLKRGFVLKIYPRSSLGTKYKMEFLNTVPIIDADYYYADNEGHIILKVRTEKDLFIKKGDKYAQGIIERFYITQDDKARKKRVGGFGSTDKR